MPGHSSMLLRALPYIGERSSRGEARLCSRTNRVVDMAVVDPKRTLLEQATKRDPLRSEADIQASIHAYLVVSDLNIDEHQARMETPSGDGTRRRIDIEVGQLVIEVKKDLRHATTLQDGELQLAGYVRTRSMQSNTVYAGVLTDGELWRLYSVTESDCILVSELDLKYKSDELLHPWLETILATQHQVAPTPNEIVQRLGATSPAHQLEFAAFRNLYLTNVDNSEVQLKRSLWAKLLRTAFGSAFDDDDTLFINHTILVLSAEIIAHAALGFDVGSQSVLQPRDMAVGTEFANALITGVVEEDFFDWVLDVEGGEDLIRSLSRRIAQFNWDHVEHDVLKLLYESVISPDDRRSLGEYYTPDWLAEAIVEDTVDRPLEQRVADVACGSGTFLFHAIRRYLDASDSAGMKNADALDGLTSHVFGMDVHPVAVTIARVTYLLAIGNDRLMRERNPLSIPVYLGDSLQWEHKRDIFVSREELRIATSGTDLVSGTSTLFEEELVFPKSTLLHASSFDRLVNALSDKATDHSSRSSRDVILPTLRQHGVAEADIDTVVETFDLMRRLHADGRDGIWGYYVRNLVRPTWLAADENKVDVLVGNPPWLRYGKMTANMQERFIALMRERNLIKSRAGATSRDLAPLFTVRAIEMYLKAEGRFALIVPHGTITRQPNAPFRTGKWDSQLVDLRVAFDESWDLSKAATGFPNHAVVVRGGRSDEAVTLPKQVLKWITKGARSDVSLEKMRERLTMTEAVIGVTDGNEPESVFSPYKKRFRQGAVLFPRMLTLTEPGAANPLGLGMGRSAVRSRKTTLDNKPWRDVPPIEKVIENAYLKPVLLSENLVPYRLTGLAKAVLPISPKKNELLSSDAILATEGLGSWWAEAENIWEANKSKSDTGSFLERIDYIGQLSAQLPVPAFRVLYTKSGNSISAAVTVDSTAIIDTGLYWCATSSVDEARYLAGILNSTVVLERIKPFMAIGLFGERHIDKNVFRARIQPFDSANDAHRALVVLVKAAEESIAALDFADVKDFKQRRKTARALLKGDGIADKIEEAVRAVVPE